ncbi:hypothetical protein WR25_00897 [Diploscapter pachys]|uniref:Hepatocellular carcinoma-associated antigen 59 domain-containing protein n=1 Tax=Diploscapter pachys TaxID=2018661 RepID=A0A2A2KVN0_9BILA|nr:hypothetical protein WR25_00897 [Diploscapter pachys]
MSLFKRPTKKVQIRKKLDEEEQDDDSMRRLEDIKELQKARERKNGLTEVECAVGKDKAAAIGAGIQIAGGAMQINSKEKAKLEAAGIEAGMREQFAKETLLRDEHEEMKRYVETNLLKETPETVNEPTPSVSHDRDTDVLMKAASKLNKYRSGEGGELLSEHMLAGIPEVDLGINARITNILETETTKKILLERAIMKAQGIEPPKEPEHLDSSIFVLHNAGLIVVKQPIRPLRHLRLDLLLLAVILPESIQELLEM